MSFNHGLEGEIMGSKLHGTGPPVHVADRELRSEINVTLRELHRFASYSQDHGNVDIRSFSI